MLEKQLFLTSTFFSLISRWTSPWLCRKRIPSTTSSAICKRVFKVSPALGKQKILFVTSKTICLSNLLTPTKSSSCEVWKTGCTRVYKDRKVGEKKRGKRKSIRRGKQRKRKKKCKLYRPDRIPWRLHLSQVDNPQMGLGEVQPNDYRHELILTPKDYIEFSWFLQAFLRILLSSFWKLPNWYKRNLWEGAYPDILHSTKLWYVNKRNL